MERKPARHDSHDYATPGAYFITIVTRGREPLFGAEGAGAAVRAAWLALDQRFPLCETDEFVVMPDHVHGVLWVLDPEAAFDRGPASGAPTAVDKQATLPQMVRAFKSLSAIAVNRSVGRSGPVWQRSYYERYVRNDRELA